MNKISFKWKILLLLATVLTLFKSVAFAQNAQGNVWDIFAPQAITDGTDVSILFLGQMFGGVDGVLHGYGSQVLGAMFTIFNAAVIGVGGIVIIYTVVVATLNTANEGEYLGRKWSSIWIPVRTAIGTALLIPKASGYSMIQIFIMWVVIQGVAAADSLWNATLQYITQAGTFLPATINAQNLRPLVTQVGSAFQSQICLAGENHFYNIEYPNNTVNLQPSYPKLTGSTNKNYMTFFPDPNTIPTNNLHNITPTDCGYLVFQPNTRDKSGTWDNAQSSAVWQVLNDLQPYATQVVQHAGVSAFTDDSTYKQAVLAIQDATLDYIAIMDPTIHDINQLAEQNLQGQFADTSKQGWMSAGSYYEAIAGTSSERKTIASNLFQNYAPLNDVGNYKDRGISHDHWLQVAAMMSTVTPDLVTAAGNGLLTGPQDQFNNANLETFPRSSSSGAAMGVVNIFTGGLGQIGIDLWANVFENNGQHWVDPIASLVYLGNRIITTVAWLWVSLSFVVFFISLVAGICSSMNPGFWAFSAFIMWFIPLATTIMTLMFAAGAVLAYYVPLVPYILFLFGALGWFLGVIESMVAAPLVALGVAHPEGQHEIFGRAEPAVMLIVNIFLRPSLMIIGFICGILLSYIGVEILNLGFSNAVKYISESGSSGWSDAFKNVAMVVIYCALVMLIINKAFSLITEVPNKVLRWIGGQEQLGDSSAPMEEVKGAVSGSVGKMGGEASQIGGEASKGAYEAGTEQGQKIRKAWDAKKGKGANINVTGDDKKE
ncbi:MAG: DotA/TraY family protein [Legionellales bacterium]|nr:DotA/TraY family protein [Legionellales bacterium]